MKEETKQEVQQILRRVVFCEIPVRWRSSTATAGAGERRSFYRGAGHDFDALDEYMPGDDPRDIDWNATAETGGQVVLRNVYLEPRDLKVFILADVRRSMNFGTVRATKRHLAAELAASICKAAETTKDRVGFIAFSATRVEKYVPTRAAKTAMYPALASILETDPSADGNGSGLSKALANLPVNRSLVFVLSDFLRLTDDEKAALRRAALVHDVICLVIQDRRERELPPGWGFLTIEDLQTGQRKTVFLSRRTRERFAARFAAHQAALIAFFKEAHCTWQVVSTEEGDAAMPKIIKLFASHTK
jgi:uncharacterized protein (DUF58 family)